MSTEGPGVETLVLLRRARDRMDREYAQPLDVVTLARSVHLSPAHFSRQFKLAYGETPYSYLMTRRIERAMVLLRRDHSVTEACFAVGAGSLGTFSTRFAELVGVTPSEYRKTGAAPQPGMLPCIARRLMRPARESNRNRSRDPSRNREAEEPPTVLP